MAHALVEAERVQQLLPLAAALQWDRSAPRAADDTGRRAVGGHSDPTADLALDPGRLYLRDVLKRVGPHLERAVADLGGIRRGLERALASWQGPAAPDEEGPSGP